jgi:molybdopterin-guanine dinucleotide biosynthesis protein MobB
MVPAVAIVGKSGAGKTCIIEKLITELKARGYRVAAVKHAHQTVEMDVEGKDTWRFMRAGSDASVISSPSKLTVFRKAKEEPGVDEALMALGDGFDIVILEGFKRGRLPRIEVHRSELGTDLVCRPEELIAVITDEKLPLELPQFNSNNTAELSDFIEREIIAGADADISVFADGKHVSMKPFVKEIVSSAIMAMLGSLKNTGIMKNVNVSIRNKV